MGLSENLAKDGYGRYFTHAVNGYFTQHYLDGLRPMGDQPPGYCEFKLPGGLRIQLFSRGVNERLDQAYGNVIAVLLLSHGASGEGSLQKGKERRPVNAKMGVGV